MTVAVLAFATAILPVIAEIIKAILNKKAQEATTDAALTRHSVDELHAATDRVQPPPPVQ